MSATWNAGRCLLVPRLPRTKKVDVSLLSPCATPATQNEGGCLLVPCLPRKVPRRHRRPAATKRATQYHKYHACHAKQRWMSPCATPAPQTEGATARWLWQSWQMVCDKVVCERWCVTKMVVDRWCVTKLCVKLLCVKDGMWQDGIWQMVYDKVVCEVTVCERWYVTKMVFDRWCVTKLCEVIVCEKWCVQDGCWQMVCDKVVCEVIVFERWHVRRWYLTDGVWQSCVWSYCVCERWCVQDGCWQMVCDKVVCDRREEGGGGGPGGAPGIQNQKHEPHTKLWGKTKKPVSIYIYMHTSMPPCRNVYLQTPSLGPILLHI